MNAAIARTNRCRSWLRPEPAGAGLLGYAATSDSSLILIGVIAAAAVAAILWDWTLGVPSLLILALTTA